MANPGDLFPKVSQLLAENRFSELVEFAAPFHVAWLAQPSEAPDDAPLVLYALGSAYRGLGALDAALLIYSNGLNLAVTRTNRPQIFVILSSVAETYFEKGDDASAVKFAKHAVHTLASHHLECAQKDAADPRTGSSEVIVKLSYYLVVAQNWIEARAMLLAARELVEAHRNSSLTAAVYDLLRKVAEAEGDLVSARDYSKHTQRVLGIAGTSGGSRTHAQAL